MKKKKTLKEIHKDKWILYHAVAYSLPRDIYKRDKNGTRFLLTRIEGGPIAIQYLQEEHSVVWC